VKAVILVAPEEARWAERAAAFLTSMHVHFARLPDAVAIGFLVVTAPVGVVLFDERSVRGRWDSIQVRLRAMAPDVRLVVVRDDGDADRGGVAVPWPDAAADAMQLLTGAD
jgi:hypothetical protein